MDEIIDQNPIEPYHKPERPLLITILCVLMGVGALFAIPMLFRESLDIVGTWYRPYLALSCMIGLVCMTGLWMMKKWSVYLYTGFAVFNQFFMFSMSVWSPVSLVIVTVFILLLFTQLHKME